VLQLEQAGDQVRMAGGAALIEDLVERGPLGRVQVQRDLAAAHDMPSAAATITAYSSSLNTGAGSRARRRPPVRPAILPPSTSPPAARSRPIEPPSAPADADAPTAVRNHYALSCYRDSGAVVDVAGCDATL